MPGRGQEKKEKEERKEGRIQAKAGDLPLHASPALLAGSSGHFSPALWPGETQRWALCAHTAAKVMEILVPATVCRAVLEGRGCLGDLLSSFNRILGHLSKCPLCASVRRARHVQGELLTEAFIAQP
jgi:hypothetical protein